MDLEVLRYSSGKESTLGLLFNVTRGREFLCYTLEDQYQSKKVKGETRIPALRYKLGLRREGGFHNRYKERFPHFHQGMIEVLDVPNFKYILWHVGNDDDDTDGCLLLGDSAFQNKTKDGFIGDSRKAYERIYKNIINTIVSGEDVYVRYIDYDNIK